MLPISLPVYLIEVSILILLLSGIHFFILSGVKDRAARKGLVFAVPLLSFTLPWISIKFDFSDGETVFFAALEPLTSQIDSWAQVLQNTFERHSLSASVTLGDSMMIIYQIGVVWSLLMLFKRLSKDLKTQENVKAVGVAFEVLAALIWFHPAIYYLRSKFTSDYYRTTDSIGNSTNFVRASLFGVLSLMLSMPFILDSHDGEMDISFKPFEKFEAIRANGILGHNLSTSDHELKWGEIRFPLEYFPKSDQINGSGYIDIGELRKVMTDSISLMIEGLELSKESIQNLSIRFDVRNSSNRDSLQRMRNNEFKDYRSIPREERDSLNRVFRRLLGRNWRSIESLPFKLDQNLMRITENISEGDNIIISGSLNEASTIYVSLTVTNQVFAGNQQLPHPEVGWGEISGYYHPGSRLCIIKCTLDEFRSTFRKPIVYRDLDFENQLVTNFSIINFDNKSKLEKDFTYLEEKDFYHEMQSGDYLLVKFDINELSKVFYVDLGADDQKTASKSRTAIKWGNYEFSRFNHLRLPAAGYPEILNLPIVIHEMGAQHPKLD